MYVLSLLLLLCRACSFYFFFFFFNDTATTEIYTLSLHDALPISIAKRVPSGDQTGRSGRPLSGRSEEHTSELQSRQYLVCRLLLEKKKNTRKGCEADNKTKKVQYRSCAKKSNTCYDLC